MPAITFRFTTECEMTFSGDSYEDIYLSFKDFIHSKQAIQNAPQVAVYPPESDQIFFHLDRDDKSFEIPYFKGAFSEDIVRYCEGHPLKSTPVVTQRVISQRVQSFIPEYYW